MKLSKELGNAGKYVLMEGNETPAVNLIYRLEDINRLVEATGGTAPFYILNTEPIGMVQCTQIPFDPVFYIGNDSIVMQGDADYKSEDVTFESFMKLVAGVEKRNSDRGEQVSADLALYHSLTMSQSRTMGQMRRVALMDQGDTMVWVNGRGESLYRRLNNMNVLRDEISMPPLFEITLMKSNKRVLGFSVRDTLDPHGTWVDVTEDGMAMRVDSHICTGDISLPGLKQLFERAATRNQTMGGTFNIAATDLGTWLGE